MIVVTYIYLKIYVQFSLRDSAFENARELSVKRLLAYPLVMVLCLLPNVIIHILDIWGIKNDIGSIMAYVIWNTHGFFNAIAYALTEPVKNYIRLLFHRNPRNSISFEALSK